MAEDNDTNSGTLDNIKLVILDDDKLFIQIMIESLFSGKEHMIVYHRRTPDFWDNIHKYNKDTTMWIDHQLHDGVGMEIAEKLHNMGYTNLCLLTAAAFTTSDMPPYLKLIRKNNISYMEECAHYI